jgi:hypothetical protein
MPTEIQTANFPGTTSRQDLGHHFHQVELANRWRISPRTLAQWRWRGKGPCFVKVGGRVVYRLADIEAYEAHQRRECGASSGQSQTATTGIG